ncbi:tripartite tricarboxylate transporter TctB family protein [Jannaschia sp. M317]|nr:tripartite tricarboxylate transporter TctB family protein [Jannaschia sp. M317]
MARLSSERAVIALCLLLLAVALTISTFGLQFADLGGAFDPTFFPRIILICWVLLAALNLAVDMRADGGWKLAGFAKVVPMALATCVYVWFLPTLGFFVCSVILATVFLLILGVRHPIGFALVALGVPLSLVILFNHVLKMPLPTSPWVWWI